MFRSLALCLLFTASAFALQPQLPQKVHQEIVVTASGVEDTIERTPAAATVISRREIEERGARDVAEVLREVPGVVVARTGSPGKVSSLFIRGGNSQHALVLWNGMEINNPFFSGYDWGRFSTVGIERVEVVPGPYSALYGSDAVSGVVNILTSEARQYFSADAAAGENGLLNGSFSGARHVGSLSVRGAAEYRSDDGFQPNDDFRQDSAIGGLHWRHSDAFSVGLQGRFTRYDLGIPRNVNAEGTAFVSSPRRRQEGSELQLLVPATLTHRGTTVDLRVSRSERDDDYSDPDDPFFLTWAATDALTERAVATVSRRSRLGHWTVGGETEASEVDDRSAYGANIEARQRESRSFFAENRVSVPLRSGKSLELSAGARYDRYDTFGSELSPRVAAAWLAGRHKLRAAYGQAFRAPSIGELYYPFFGNRDLGPEHGRSVEIGYDAFLRTATFSLSAFRAEYTGLIVYDNLTNTFGNVASAETGGFEFGVSGRIGGGWTGAGSYTWLDSEDKATGEPLLRRPRHSGSISVGYQRGAFGALLVGVHNGDRADVTDLFPYGRVTNGAYTTADLTFRYTMGPFTPYLKVENITDERYEEIFGYASARRRALLGLRYGFGR
jgi:vitamin B12 transporter